MGSFQAFAGMGSVVLVDGSTLFQPTQAVEDLQRIFICQPVVAVVAQSADGKVGLVQPDGATSVAVRIVFGIVGGNGREGDIRGELCRILKHGQHAVHLRLCGNPGPQRSVGFAARLFDE